MDQARPATEIQSQSSGSEPVLVENSLDADHLQTGAGGLGSSEVLAPEPIAPGCAGGAGAMPTSFSAPTANRHLNLAGLRAQFSRIATDGHSLLGLQLGELRVCLRLVREMGGINGTTPK